VKSCAPGYRANELAAVSSFHCSHGANVHSPQNPHILMLLLVFQEMTASQLRNLNQSSSERSSFLQATAIMKLVTTTVVFISLTFTTLAAPANPSTPAHDVAPTFPAPSSSPPGNYCGKALLTGTGRLRELRTSELWYKCITLDQGENYGPCINQYCGLCVMFKYVIAVDLICMRGPLTWP
jgi:hypothetical protein